MSYNFFEESLSLKISEQERLRKIQIAIHFTIFTLGGPATMVCFLVLARLRQVKSSFNCCLRFLAIINSFFLLCHVYHVNTKQMTYFAILVLMTLTISVWIIALMSLERYISVCHPIRAATLCTHRRLVYCNIFIIFFGIAVNLPRSLLSKNIYISDYFDISVYMVTRFGSDLYIHREQYLSEQQVYIVKFYGWMGMAIMFFIPLTITASLSFFIYRAMGKSKTTSPETTLPETTPSETTPPETTPPETLPDSQEEERQLFMILLSIAAVLFFCCIPVLIYEGTSYCGIFPFNVHVTLGLFVQPIMAMYSASNFIIYFSISKEFRSTLMNLLRYLVCLDKKVTNAKTKEESTSV